MNYAGKFDAASFLDGQGSHLSADGHIDSAAAKPFIAKAHGHVPEGAVVVPDPNLIFNGDFKRAGSDLVLSHDGHEFVVHDYFRGDKRAAISSPDGAHLTGDIVNALAGHVEYAQAGPGAAAAAVIGHVTKLVGSATAVRNGVSIILNNGDNVEKGDVVSTGSDSTLGVTFIDGTVFGLSSNARMVLNEMVYDPNGSNNSSLLSLVAGTITFVAGETAKHGDMKIDTPVATMGIRGTAVLTQINFVVPSGGGDPQPQASFQVLVEPNGTTGSYILFDKTTLLPIATVNQAGQMIQISGGNVSISNALLSPDVQKLITDVFTLKFTDNGTNTKLTTNFTDSITQNGNIVVIKTDNGTTATATYTNTSQPTSQDPSHNPSTSTRVPGPPLAQSLDLSGNVKQAFTLTEHSDTTADLDYVTGETVGPDTFSFRITFVDQNLGDSPTVSVDLANAPNYVYTDASHHDVTGSLSALQKQDIAATQVQIGVAAASGNNNNGSAVLTYTVPDHAFDFLADGETLTLTYTVLVNNNFALDPEAVPVTITITVTGTNDKPVITTSVPNITFSGGTSVPGGPLSTDVPTSGTLTFKDVDLTDTHSVSVALTSATLPDGSVPPGPLAAFAKAMSVAIATGSDSTGTGTGTINWSLADLPVYLADFIPKGEVLTLVYTVTVADEHNAISQQTITVTITGTDAPAVVWIATSTDGAPPGGFWKDAANWETGTVPTLTDDVIVITDQLHGLTPSYPVTIDAAAYANSITMNDFGGPPPEVDNKSSLTIAGTLSMGADSIFNNTATGTMSVGGKAEILDTSVLTNAGYLTLAGGGDFASGTTITNSGTIELSGGTLKTLAEIHNAGGTLKADAGTTLIVDTATVDGGTVTILGTLELDGTSLIENGTLNNSGAVNVKGVSELANEIVANMSTGTIEVSANDALTIDQGSAVTNAGNITVDATGKLTVNGASITGVGTVTDNGEIDLTGNAVLSNGALKNNAAFKVSGTGNALDNETITNASTGTIEVLANGALTIDQGSVVTNTGNVTVDATGKLTVNGASITGVGTVTDNGEIDLTGNAVLSNGALKNNAAFKVSGTGNALDNETITNASTGTIEVLANGALTIDQGSVVTNTGNVTVDATGKLTVNGASITGVGTVTDNGEIDLTGNAVLSGGTLKNNATFKVSGTGNALDNETITNASTGTIEVLANGALTIDQGSVVTNTGNVTVDATGKLTVNDASITGVGTVTDNGEIDLTGNAVLSGGTLKNNAAFKVSGTGNALDNETITNSSTGTIEVLANGALTIDQGSVVTNTGNVTVDATGKLTVNGASITGVGTVTDNGEIDLTGSAVLSGGALKNNAAFKVSGTGNALDNETITNSSTGTIEVLANGALTIDQGSVVTNTGNVTVDATGKLTVNGASITGVGTVTDNGEIDLTGNAVLSNGALKNNAAFKVSGTGNALDNETITNASTGTIEVLANGALTIDQGSVVTNTGNVTVDATGKLTVNGASITGVGTVTDNGEIDLTGSAVLSGGALKNNAAFKVSGTGNALDNETITNSSTGTIEVLANGALTIDQGSVVTNTGNVTVDATGKLTVNGASITGVGTVTDNGEIDLTGSAVLSNGALKNNAAFKVSGTGNALDNETITNASTGTIEVLANGALTIDQGSVVTNTGNVTVDATGKLTVNGASITGVGTVTDNGEIDLTGNALLSGGALKNNAAFKASGTGNALDNETVTNASTGTIEVLANGALTIDQGSVVTNTGNVTVDATGKLTVNGASISGVGTVTDNGEIDLTGNAVLSNGALKNNAAFKVSGTGNALDNETVANASTGTIEVLANGALTIDQGSVVTNTGNVTVDATGKLTVNGASITGVGTVTDNGEIDLTGNAVLSNGALKNNAAFKVSGTGNALDNETVANASTGTIEVLANGALTIDQGSVVTNTGNVTVDATGKLTVNGASISGVGTVTDNGEIDLTGNAVLSNGALKNNATFKVSGTGNALDNETVTNASTGTIEVLANGALTIDQGSVVTNTGNVTVDATGKLTVNGASITGVGTVTDNGEIDLTGNAVLSNGALKNNAAFKVSGTGNALDDETVKNAGTIEVLANGALAIDQGSTVDNSSGNLVVDANAALTLNDATISGGAVKGGGSIDVTGASKIDSGATLSVTAVTADAQLTLDGVTVSGSTITDNASIELDNTVKLKDGATIKGGPVTNSGTLEIAGAATLLNDVVTNNGTVTVDDGQTLKLSGTEITGGTINNYSGASGGTIDVTADSTIDGNATLNKGAVTVESDVTLKLNDATVSGTAITNDGTVKVDASKKLTLAGASLTGGTLTVAGTLDSSGSATITNANISNSYLIEAIGGVLALVATTPAAAITNDGGTIQANTGELDINGEAVTNTGTLAAINDGTLKLISMTVTNTGGAVSIESGSTLDLSGATVDGGTMTIAGTLESTGTSAITDADITNTGTITVTGGTLTIDPAVPHTITNSHLIQANGGELDISGELVTNSADLKAINGGILKLSNVTVTNGGGTVTVDGTSKLYLSNVSAINGGQLSNSGHLYGVSGANSVSAAVTNTGTIEVQGGTLNLSGGLTGAGSLVIDDSATLELAGATAQTVTFAGGTDTLQLDKVAGQSFTGTITGQSSTGGTFTVTGAADITTSSNDALDFTATGGTSAKSANIVLTPTGALKGAANGVVVTQNGTGNISLTATKDITGLAGNGITLRDSATGAGDITIDDLTGKATGTGANSEGILVENLNAANAGNISITQLGGAVGGAYGIDATTQGDGNVTIDAGGAITGSSIYGIRARSYGAGNETVSTEAGSVVTSGSSGIIAVNRAISLDASNDSTITVDAHGTINSGSNLNQSGNAPAGIQAGYAGATSGTSANTDVNGTVIVNNHANITAAGGHGIDAYNYGNGDVTVNDGAGTTVVGAQMGVRALALSGGTGNVSVWLGDNASVTGTAGYGIDAYSLDQGNISVSLSDHDTITSGSSGILAVNEATSIASGVHSTIQVTAHGTIHSGSTSNLSGATPGGIVAGYNPGEDGKFSSKVYGDVTVTSDATITAAAGYGIEAFTWGIGKVTVSTGDTSSITAAGTAIGAFDHGGGDVSVTNEGSATGSVALGVVATGAGNVTILNDGDLTATGTAGIVVTQNDASATGSTHITNTGSVVGASGHYAIFVQENTTGAATIDNSGTIGPNDAGTVGSTTYAIAESGGHVTINNTGDINGNISVATATFNNEADGTWTVSGTSVFGNLSSIVNDGVIDLLNGASISGTGLNISNSNEIDSWGTASISGTITNTGSIEVNTGTLSVFGSLSGSGSVTIDANATLDVNATVSQTITFGGDGAELRIDTSSFGGSVAGFAATDKLDLSTIKFDGGTSATYDSETGDLVVSDAYGHSIMVKLTGADYSNAHFAGSTDGHGGTLITLNASDDAPAFTAAEASPSVTFAELADTTGATTTYDPASGGTGTIHFTDIDLTERPTAKITHQDVTGLAADHTTALTLTPDEISALEHALTLQQAGNKNDGTIGWTYSVADSSLDFLGKDQTVTVMSTIELKDHNGGCDTAQVTVTITGTNDAPTVAAVTTGPLVDTAAADTFSDITGQLVGTDADTGETATLTYAVLDADSHTATTVAGHYGALTVNSDGSYDYVPDATAINALSAGPHVDTFTVQTTDAHGATGTATFTVNVTGANDAPTLADLSIGTLTDTGVTDSFADLTGKLAGTDADTGETASLTYTVLDADHHATTTVAGHYGALTVNSDGSYDYVPDATAINALSTGSYVDTFTVQTTDVHGVSGTATLTVNVNGANDAPTLDGATLTSVSGDDTDPAGTAVSDLFAGKFHDVDAGASFKAIAVSADHATADQGSWQYEIAGTDQWVDISGVSDSSALVLSTDTLIRFVPNEGFSGTPGTLDVHGLDNTYTGAVSTSSAVSIDISGAGHGGTTPVSDQAASIGTEVTAPTEVETAVAPVLSLGPNTSIYPTDGAALVTPLSLHAGDIVSLDWNFTTDDYLPFNDFAFASVNGAAFLLSDIEATGSYGSTGWHTFTYTVQTDGTYSFGTGVMNEKDYAVTSFLAVDNIRVNGEVVQSFEDGFGDTSTTGQVAIVSTAHSDVNDSQIVPTDGNFEAFLSSYPTYQASIEGFLGLSSGELSNIAKSEGPEHTAINVPITVTIPTGAHPDDTYVTIAGAPAGSEFNYGAYDASNNTWHIEATDLGGNLALTTPVGYVGSFNLTVTATSVVDSSHTSATTLPQTHAVTIDPVAGPEIDTTHFTVSENPDGTTSVLGLAITDEDPAAPSEAFALSASTQFEGSSVSPETGAGNLSDINTFLASGITYDPGEDKPATDMVTFKVNDSFGASDTVNFIFSEGGSGPVSLVGTGGKDVLFGTHSSDTLNGNGGQDQFVFSQTSSPDNIQHTVLGFDTTLDKIDVRQFGNINAFSDLTIAQQNADTLVTLDDHETILLKNVVAGNLHANDFIITNHSGGGIL
ncbi:VCBS domain-containing protein [Bradyrhizobium commune]|uniref:Cadherin domain-containing protein n=1 Tax=Bradyrhizobium commune TaxID=83627 RepID=A0A7S9D520_9BRAD|nr:VCBS domain-containing protein [Bradyrhizobium commune]QPF91352.1 hypothetical protein IC761_33725 [Bradyrhizobium commune]